MSDYDGYSAETVPGELIAIGPKKDIFAPTDDNLPVDSSEGTEDRGRYVVADGWVYDRTKELPTNS